MKDNRRKKIYMALSGVAIVAMMGISFASIRGCTRNDVATPTEATATDAVSEVTTVVDKTTEVVTTEKVSTKGKESGSISGGVKGDHNTKEGTSEEKSDDNDTKTPGRTTEGTTEYTGSTEEPTTQRQADNDDGSTKKPPKKDEGKKDDGGKKEPEKSTQTPVTPEKPAKPDKPDKPAKHVHTWKECTKEHPAITHKETKNVKVKDAWDEKVTTEVYHIFCGGCDMDFTAAGYSSSDDYITLHTNSCKGGSSYYGYPVPETKTVHHDAVYEDRTITVTDKEAWTERWVECTTCGARQ